MLQILATAFIELNESKPPRHREWKAKRTGFIALEKDYVLKAYVFRLYDNEVTDVFFSVIASINLT